MTLNTIAFVRLILVNGDGSYNLYINRQNIIATHIFICVKVLPRGAMKWLIFLAGAAFRHS